MAIRPVFVPVKAGPQLVREEQITFTWHSGFAKSQAQKSIQSLHDAAALHGIAPIPEISSKSPEPLGVQLSAFNLKLNAGPSGLITVESAYQGSKVFEGGHQYDDLYRRSARDAKLDERVRSSGELEAFRFLNEEWPLEPRTAFYDWLYIAALQQNPMLSEGLVDYKGFSDIAFNPERSINCQARAAAYFVALSARGLLDEALSGKDTFIRLTTGGRVDPARTYDNASHPEQQKFW